MSHVPHALIYAGLCSLPLLIWLPLWLWAEDEPRNDDQPDADDEEPELVPLTA
jgi:hypothetical protein